MKNRNQLKIFFLFLFFILMTFSPTSFSQQENRNNKQSISDIMALKLKQKVILTDDQTAKVKIILANYIEDLNNNKNLSANLEKAKNNIGVLLNEKQAAKYNIIKDDFFDELNKRALNTL
jgi:hypothetical protein